LDIAQADLEDAQIAAVITIDKVSQALVNGASAD
jgi:hypothetical protein